MYVLIDRKFLKYTPNSKYISICNNLFALKKTIKTLRIK